MNNKLFIIFVFVLCTHLSTGFVVVYSVVFRTSIILYINLQAAGGSLVVGAHK
jgi:hypothetical protein